MMELGKLEIYKMSLNLSDTMGKVYLLYKRELIQKKIYEKMIDDLNILGKIEMINNKYTNRPLNQSFLEKV